LEGKVRGLKELQAKNEYEVTIQNNEYTNLLTQHKELDERYKLKSIELDDLKKKLNSIEQINESNKNLTDEIKIVKEDCTKEKEALIKNLKDKIVKHDHISYDKQIEIMKNQKECKNHMREVKDFLEIRISEFADYIEEVNKKVGFQAKKASKVFAELRELCKDIISNVNYISNENPSSQVKIDLDNNDTDQIYINLKEAIKRMDKAYLKIKSQKETKIEELKKKIIELNTSIEEYKATIKSNEDSTKDKEAKLMQYTSSLNKEKISLEEMQEEITKLAKAKDELNKQLEDFKSNETNLKEECNKLKEEKSKVDDNIKILEKDLKDLKDENEKVKRESEDLNNKILSLENTKTKLEEDNPLLKVGLKNYKQGNESLKKQIEEEQSKAEELKKEINALEKREAELTNCIKNVKENLFKLIEDKFSVIKQIIIKTDERVINLDKKLKSVIETRSEAKDNSEREQSPSKQIDITKEDNQKERQKFILHIQSIIGEFELLKNEAQNLLANKVKVTREVVINQFKGICQLIHQRELRLVKKIEGSYETAKKKLSTLINMEDKVTSKVNDLKYLMTKLKSEASRRTVTEDYMTIDIIAPVPGYEDIKINDSKDICNIELIDPIHPHEIFRTGILKDVTKENLYETKFIKLASEICCFCLKEKAEQKAICLYHSKCNKCLIKTKKDCILCQAFVFKPLDFTCDHCKNIASLPDITILSCMHKKCNPCTKTGTCKICNGIRLKLSVRVL